MLSTSSLSYATNASGAPSTNRVSSYTYDSAGNPTSASGYSFAYDAANRIKSVGTNPREYDGDGRRVKNDEANAGNIVLFYLWSSVLGQVVADLRADYASWNLPFRAYVYSPSGALFAQQSYSGGLMWTHTDHLGSGHKLTDSTGAVVAHDEYDPHGQWVLSTGSLSGYFTSNKFTGYERDYAAGSHYAKARQYHHNNGRFLQADPLGLAASDLRNPQSLNLYSYVQNDPVNFTDPSGLNAEEPIIRIRTWAIGPDVPGYADASWSGGFGWLYGGSGGDPDLGIGIGGSGTGGDSNNTQQIPDCAKAFFASLFPELNLNDVVIHDGLPAVVENFNTLQNGVGAVTIGKDIYFPKGTFNVRSNAGLAKFGHELVHVRQYNALGKEEFLKQYVSEYVENVKNQLSIGSSPGIFEWAGMIRKFKPSILDTAYREISFELSAYAYGEKLLNWLDAKPGRNPCQNQ